MNLYLQHFKVMVQSNFTLGSFAPRPQFKHPLVARLISVVLRFWAGDILGRALENLDGLLQMPYGCGEQNMALLAPDIYILEYLRDTQQLTPAIRNKATNFLTSGEAPFYSGS